MGATEDAAARRLAADEWPEDIPGWSTTIRRVRAIVTGGAGFIGSHVTGALLARGDEVTVLDNFASGRRENVAAEARLAEVDIRTDALDGAFDDARPEVCFHLAAQADVRVSVEQPAEDASVNVLGTVRVLEAARRHGTQVVFASTGGAIYGECERPAVEADPRLPVSPYGAAKLAAEEYLAAYNRLYGTSHVALRFGNVFGPRQDPHGEAGVVAIFLGRLAEGTPCRIFGDGRQTRDYVYVGDIARATLAAAGQAGGVFNVGTGVETSVLELFERCRDVAGGGPDAEHAPARLGELQRSFLDARLAERVLGWRAETSLDEGLRTTWESIRK
jgi:UDP-glucose 4-epimerase